MSETGDKFIDKVIDNATTRLRIPIVSTYIIVLLVHNWDLFYYLLFQSGEATTKIAYIKKNYPNYWDGIFEAIGIAICVLITVSLLDLSLSWLLKKVYKKKKKITDEINEYKRVDELQNAFKEQTIEIKKIKEDLTKSNGTIDTYFENINELKQELKNYDDKIDSNKHLFDFTKLITNICSINPNNQTVLMNIFTLILKDISFEISQGTVLTTSELVSNRIDILQISTMKQIYLKLENEDYIIINSFDGDVINFQILEKVRRILRVMKYVD